jgi:hypothetical protein
VAVVDGDRVVPIEADREVGRVKHFQRVGLAAIGIAGNRVDVEGLADPLLGGVDHGHGVVVGVGDDQVGSAGEHRRRLDAQVLTC